MKMLKILCAFMFLVILAGCNQNVSEPEDAANVSLAKTTWSVSPTQYWPYQMVIYACDTAWYNQQFFSFSYHGYNFKFKLTTDHGSVYEYSEHDLDVYVNDIYQTQSFWRGVTWGQGWQTWTDFSFNGLNMSYRYNINVHAVEACGGAIKYEDRITSVEVRIWDKYYLDSPAGFSAAPDLHNNMNQLVTVSWSASTDADVTGYEIQRMKYFLNSNGQVANSTYTLVKTVNGRGTGTLNWVDSPAWGTNPHLGIGYVYRIRAVSSTRGVQSPWLGGQYSYLEGYDDVLP